MWGSGVGEWGETPAHRQVEKGKTACLSLRELLW